MKPKAVRKKLLTAALIVIGVLILTTAAALISLEVRTNAMLDDYSTVYDNEKYQKKVMADNVEVITQDISCGYAVIEMFSSWDGKSITEEALYSEYGRVVTSTGKSFRDEMNKQFPEYTTTMHKYLSNTELIDKVYNSLSRGIPVPFEWAAQYNGEEALREFISHSLKIRIFSSLKLIIEVKTPNRGEFLKNPQCASRTRWNAL
ncbi:MAG: hypothetical protein HFJ89_01950 [Oscillospiraceae bacterium]|nr:hypothetical protein [Oscillospiraceae bacterium]